MAYGVKSALDSFLNREQNYDYWHSSVSSLVCRINKDAETNRGIERELQMSQEQTCPLFRLFTIKIQKSETFFNRSYPMCNKPSPLPQVAERCDAPAGGRISCLRRECDSGTSL